MNDKDKNLVYLGKVFVYSTDNTYSKNILKQENCHLGVWGEAAETLYVTCTIDF